MQTPYESKHSCQLPQHDRLGMPIGREYNCPCGKRYKINKKRRWKRIRTLWFFS